MNVNLIKIGNSLGIRLPKAIINQLRLGNTLDMQVENDALVIRNAHSKRKGWAAAAEQCNKACDDKFDDWDILSSEFPEEKE